MFILEKSVIINCPIEKAFEFHKDINNLKSISPDGSNVKIDKANLPLVKGSDIYLIFTQLHIFKTKWQIRITEFDPPVKFSDVQVKGPFRSWKHIHSFADIDGKTKMTDRIEYRMPFGIIGKFIHDLFLKRMIARTFEYRHKETKKILDEVKVPQPVYS